MELARGIAKAAQADIVFAPSLYDAKAVLLPQLHGELDHVLNDFPEVDQSQHLLAISRDLNKANW